jgi:hypothetical protein
MAPVERFCNLLDYLKQNKNMNSRGQYSFVRCYKGYFCHQITNNLKCRMSVQHFREDVLCLYQGYLEISRRWDKIKYHSQW